MSGRSRINIVWLKRDLRTQDHEPLFNAESAGFDYLSIYIFEPSALQYHDSSLRHQQFVFHSILTMNQKLIQFNRKVEVFYGEAVEVFNYLLKTYELHNVFSYQESGILSTWDRDKAVQVLFESENVSWHESEKNGVCRGLRNRQGWDQSWHTYVNEEIIENKFTRQVLQLEKHPFSIPDLLYVNLKAYPSGFQLPGERYAWRYLKTFCEKRGRDYNKFISKPFESRKSCGRISPFLAWGNLSIRQACQYIRSHSHYSMNKRSFDAILSRMKWHSHFVQKFEVECEYETQCVNRGYELLQYSNDVLKLDAWKEGMTGFPLVDACMRCLKETGWINFRMRAMLVSFLTHHLDCDWRLGVYHLAKLFLDYLPGIHYPQFQMGAGTTGVNTIRMYNPIKQSKDHDPSGLFIKLWVDELQSVPVEFIHEPWKMTALEKSLTQSAGQYPHPIINLTVSGRAARKKIWGHRSNPKVKDESKRILLLHTRNDDQKKIEAGIKSKN